MCLLATVHLFEFAHELSGFECPFHDDLDKIREAHTDLREDKFLDSIFGEAASKMDNDPWLKAITSEAKWVFNSKDLRKEVFI